MVRVIEKNERMKKRTNELKILSGCNVGEERGVVCRCKLSI